VALLVGTQPALPPQSVRTSEPGRLDSWAFPGQALLKSAPEVVAEGESLRGAIVDLKESLRQAGTLAQAAQFERDEFREEASRLYARVLELTGLAKKARTDLRNEKQKSQQLVKQLKSAKADLSQQPNPDGLFPDPETQFTFEVDVEYAYRIPAGDKAARPRHDLHLGSEFLSTLGTVEGVDRSKVVAVTVEIITDLVNELESRDLHPLREGRGAAERDVVRTSDGGRCMRVALQTGTPSARRLHYWKVGDAIELSRVVKHDDMTP